MKKEGIQSRNRKLSVKSRRRRRARSAATGTGVPGAKYCYERPSTLFRLPPAADRRAVTAYLDAEGSLATGSSLSAAAERRPCCPIRCYPDARYISHSPPHRPSPPSCVARYATPGCAAMLGGATTMGGAVVGGAGHVTPWGAPSPYQHFAGPCASSGIISAIV